MLYPSKMEAHGWRGREARRVSKKEQAAEPSNLVELRAGSITRRFPSSSPFPSSLSLAPYETTPPYPPVSVLASISGNSARQTPLAPLPPCSYLRDIEQSIHRGCSFLKPRIETMGEQYRSRGRVFAMHSRIRRRKSQPQISER